MATWGWMRTSRHRRSNGAGSAQSAIGEPRSLVRLLASDDELREAVIGAERFERGIAATLRARTERYEAMASPHIRVVDPGPPGAEETAHQPRSA